MKKTLIAAFVCLSAILQLNATVVQKVTLKNGTKLEGYIQKQDKNDNITFRSESATIFIKGKDATITERTYKYSELDSTWQKWAEENDAFTGTGDARTLTLNEIIFTSETKNDSDSKESSRFEEGFAAQHGTVSKVKVLEKGVNIKYIELTPDTYTFGWNDVDNITADRRSKTDLSGIDRIYQLKNGKSVRGQYAGESYTTLSLYTGSGMVETFDIDNVKKYFYKAVNPGQSIFEQSELLDVVNTKNSGTVKGIIVERNFTDSNNYLIIQLKTGSSQMIKFTDVVEYYKEENPDYAPKTDILLEEGEVVINRLATKAVNVTKSGSTIVLDCEEPKLVLPAKNGTAKVIVEYYNPRKLSSDHLMLVAVDRTLVKKNVVFSFSSDIYDMKKYVPTSSETSVNNTTRLEYDLNGKGTFALYDQQTKQAIPFVVK